MQDDLTVRFGRSKEVCTYGTLHPGIRSRVGRPPIARNSGLSGTSREGRQSRVPLHVSLKTKMTATHIFTQVHLSSRDFLQINHANPARSLLTLALLPATLPFDDRILPTAERARQVRKAGKCDAAAVSVHFFGHLEDLPCLERNCSKMQM